MVGVACRLPGTHSPHDIRERPLDGRHTRSGLSPTPASAAGETGTAPHTGASEHADGFDAAFFGIRPREAATMDPLSGVLLELAWEALEDAAVVPAALRGSRIAVHVAAHWDDVRMALEPGHPPAADSKTHRASPAHLVAQALRLSGPRLTLGAGEPSTLLGVRLAAAALSAGEVTAALVGEVRRRAGAPHGGMLFLKTLERARADRDSVYAVLRGGREHQPVAATGPPVPARGARPSHHPAPARAFVPSAGRRRGAEAPVLTPAGAGPRLAPTASWTAAPLLVGLSGSSTRVEETSGILGLLRTVLRAPYGGRPPRRSRGSTQRGASANSRGPHRSTGREDGPGPGRPEAPEARSPGHDGDWHLAAARTTGAGGAGGAGAAARTLPWIFSGKSVEAVRGQAARLYHHLRERPWTRVEDVGWSLASTRTQFGYRAVLLGAERGELLSGLAALASEHGTPVVRGGAESLEDVPGAGTRPVFVFPGHSTHWPGMARELYGQARAFTEALDACFRALRPYVDWDPHTVLDGRMDHAEVAQPLSWAVMVALARLWQAYGVRPAAVVGHGPGEIAAAVAVGALSLDDGARVAALASRVLAADHGGKGGMLSVALPASELHDHLARVGGGIGFAALNSPSQTVVSGERESLERLRADLVAGNVSAWLEPVDYAAHSARVDAALAELRGGFEGVTPRATGVPIVSTVTGGRLNGSELDAAYWCGNLRAGVRFHEAVTTLVDEGHYAFLEISAHPVLGGSVAEVAESSGREITVVGTLRRADGGLARFLDGASRAWAAGVGVNWRRAFDGLDVSRADLPTYAFQRPRQGLPGGTGLEGRDG
ncbi:type I polyketide synthase [Streptomyces sp. AJS327]|uniref:acyltransferase domain-containing protein n=1 Tax=Streptomyces sp. AJS327 TaxID=2545265 RepID=UPI0015DF67F0|nr:type I polyketide synthase [Streptomyces sp. AJS327]